MNTKYDLMMIEFDRDGKNWTITQRTKHYMIFRDRPQSVKFMLIVTEPPNASTREVIKSSREFTEVAVLSNGARAPVELVPRQGWLKHEIESDQATATCVAYASTREHNVDSRN